MKYIFSFLMVLANLSLVHAQDVSESVFEETEEGGAIQDASFEIVKERVNSLEKLDRRFERIPPLAEPEKDSKLLNYEFNEKQISLEAYKTKVRPTKIKQTKKIQPKNNLVSVGFGNYISPFLEAYLVSDPSSGVDWALHTKHFSSLNGSVDNKNSGFSSNLISTTSAYSFSDYLATAKLSYQREGLRYYGYDGNLSVPSVEDIKQVYHDFKVNAGLKNLDSESFLWETEIGYDYTMDHYSTSESTFKLDANLDYKLSDGEWALALESSLRTGSFSLAENKVSRTHLEVFPNLKYSPSEFMLQLGLNLNYQNDSSGQVIGNATIFPMLDFRYTLLEKVNLNLGLKGGIIQNTYSGFVEQNPYLDSAVNLQNTAENYNLYFKGAIALSENLNLEAGMSLASYKNMTFYVNGQQDSSRFQVIYDRDNTSKTQLFLNANYTITKKIDAGFSLDYYKYKTSTLQEAWQKPSLEMKFFLNNKINDKLWLSTVVGMLSGIKARVAGDVLGEFRSEELKTILDIDLKGEYEINEDFSAFLKLNNLLSQKQQLYYRYPSQGILALIGCSYSF